MKNLRLLFVLGGIALLIVGIINRNAVIYAGLGLLFLALFFNDITKNQKKD